LFQDGGTQATTHKGGTIVQGQGNVINQYGDEFREFIAGLPPNRDKAQDIREAAKKYARINPQSNGPWPFVVVADSSLGLKVRTSGLAQGVQVGSVAFKAPLWIECKRDTGFNPEPDNPNGSVWYQTKWPNDQPTTEYFNSSPADQFQQWVYGGLIVPVGHNGNVPVCR
jgi:hypothetical protein